MVNDGSTDDTQSLIEEIATAYKNIILINHEKNQGGGAARNTAVQNSRAKVIFCLDSDDLLAPNTLDKMFKSLHEKNVEGVVFSGSKSFKNDIKQSSYRSYGIDEKIVSGLERIFASKPWGVGVNFMYTKHAHALCGGYPEYHSFDTQGYGIRFLKNGLRAFVEPDSYFYHRQFSNNVSYFERSHNSGEFSFNHFLMFNEISNKFSGSALEILYTTDLFTNSRISDKKHLVNQLKDLHSKKPQGIFIQRHNEAEVRYEDIFFGNNAMLQGDFISAIKHYTAALKKLDKDKSRNVDILIMMALAADRLGTLSVDSFKTFLRQTTFEQHSLRPSVLRFIKRKLGFI
jgi:glycosyltransferase involved in cell wall biosynthesis